MPLPFSLLDAALRGTLVALLVLLAAVVLRDRPGAAAARAGVALCLGLCAQVVAATPAFEASVPLLWQAPLIAVSVANAVLFWVFACALFDDDFAPRARYRLAWLGAAGLSLLNCLLLANPGQAFAAGAPLLPFTGAAQRLLPLLGALLAVLAAAAQWRGDLVERRRRLRVFIVVTGVLYTLAMMAVRLASPQGRLSPLSATLDALALWVIVAVVAWRLLRFDAADLFPASPPASATVRRPEAPPALSSPTNAVVDPAADLAEARLASALQRLMAEERAYRTEDLTIAGLAQRLGVPEYRLRRLINQRLGHRNFNAFVNGWRLDEARAALADPARRELPVLTIALTAGFQSIGPFNRAFKAATGVTPTEFRRQKLADC